MPTDKGVIQGYTGVAAVDEKHQIIVEAQAHGTGSEQELLLPMTEAIDPSAKEDTVLCTDSGYYSEDNLEAAGGQGHRGVHPRQRVPQARSALRRPGPAHRQARCAVGQEQEAGPQAQAVPAGDFKVAQDHSHCICPAGKRLYRNGNNCNIGGHRAIKFTGAQRDCKNCPLRAQCLRHPQRTPVRQVAIFLGKHEGAGEGRRAHEAQDRHRQRAGDDRPALCHRGAGVRQPQIQQGAQPLHLERPTEGRRTVEAVLPGAQHREAGQQRIRSMRRQRREMSQGQMKGEQRSSEAQSVALQLPSFPAGALWQPKHDELMMSKMGAQKPAIQQPR